MSLIIRVSFLLIAVSLTALLLVRESSLTHAQTKDAKGDEKEAKQPERPKSNMEALLKVLLVPQVRREIEISDEQLRTIQIETDAIRNELEKVLRRRIDSVLEDVLTETQIRRLYEITAQLLGVDLLFDPVVIEKLELTLNQRRQLNEVRLSMLGEIQEVDHIFKGKENETDRFLLQGELRDELRERMLRILTATQRRDFEAMLGAKSFPIPHIPGISPKGPKGEPKEDPNKDQP